jgi:hypothetical protein
MDWVSFQKGDERWKQKIRAYGNILQRQGDDLQE